MLELTKVLRPIQMKKQMKKANGSRQKANSRLNVENFLYERTKH